MKKILIIVVLSLTFTSCMTVSESRRQYIGKTYVVEMGTGKVYIEFASDKDCKLDLLKTIWVCLHIHAYMDQ